MKIRSTAWPVRILFVWLTLFSVPFAGCEPVFCQIPGPEPRSEGDDGLLLHPGEMDVAMRTPDCLEGFRPVQSGPLVRLDAPEGSQRDSTFLVEPVQFRSEGFLINGWLYLPEKGDRFPLVVLTNGGGGDQRPIKSLSDFIAPVLAHCGVAAFVHDKRGTGESEGVFRDTDYEDYINDTGNAGLFLSEDPRFDPDRIGVLGGSEGGRVAVVAANRFPVFSFVVSMMGPTISMVEDRFLAESNAARRRGLGGVPWEDVEPLWRGIIEAFGSGNPTRLEEMDRRLLAARETLPRRVVPFTSREMEGGGIYDEFRPTWRSLRYDYVTEMEEFRKPWLAIYGAEDPVVPAEPNIQEIWRTSALSGNRNVSIAVFPRCGHSPVDSETGQRIHFENLILNWMQERGLREGPAAASRRP